MSIALMYSVKTGKLSLPAPFFFLKTALSILGPFYMNGETFCSSFVKNVIGNLIGIALNL